MDSLFETYYADEAGITPYDPDCSYFKPAMKEICLRVIKAKVLGVRIVGIVVAEWFARVLQLEMSPPGELYHGPLFIRSGLLGHDIPVRSISVGHEAIMLGGDPLFRLEAA